MSLLHASFYLRLDACKRDMTEVGLKEDNTTNRAAWRFFTAEFECHIKYVAAYRIDVHVRLYHADYANVHVYMSPRPEGSHPLLSLNSYLGAIERAPGRIHLATEAWAFID